LQVLPSGQALRALKVLRVLLLTQVHRVLKEDLDQMDVRVPKALRVPRALKV
jgi:hypothetical protein